VAVSAAAVREFLESAKLINGVSADRLSRYLFLYEKATKSTTTLTGMPGGGGSDRGAVLATLADADDDSKRWDAFAKERRKLVKKFINEAEITNLQKAILVWRYVACVEWNMIFDLLRNWRDMSESTMYREHNRALDACADWVNRTGKYVEEISK
jgi:hypothetical protein